MKVKELRQKFKKAFQTLQPQEPLLTRQQQEKFLVPFSQDTLNELKELLELMPFDSEKNKIVLSGHTGCGKSTLLAKLRYEIENDYCVVFFSIADYVPPSDIGYIVLLFAMFLELLKIVRSNPSLEIDKQFQQDWINWLAATSGIDMRQPIGFDTSRWEIEKESWFLDAIMEQLKTSNFRDRINEYFVRKVSDLIKPLNTLSKKVSEKIPLLFIIDDLDKVDLNTARSLFDDNIKSLFETCCTAIFTVPISSLRDTSINSSIRQECYELVQMPTVKLIAKDARRNEQQIIRPQAKNDLKEILLKHIDENLFDNNEEIIEKLILASGGVIRELVRIASICTRLCFGKLSKYSGDEEIKVVIDEEVLSEAKGKIWRDMSQALGSTDKDIIEYVYDNLEAEEPENQQFLFLLKGIYIIEYVNNDLWYDVFPIVAEGLNLSK